MTESQPPSAGGPGPVAAGPAMPGRIFDLLDNVTLTSVGVDIGSSTSHLMFSRVRLRREALGLSSRYRVVSREVLWRSPVVFTPYLADGLIDADAVAGFVGECRSRAGIAPEAVDTGAVILTGEALKRRNARALAGAVASGSGDFVCVSAGHNLEALLAAHGSGSVEASCRDGTSVLCVDIGGGTTKLALIKAGEVVATAAIEVGGRMVAWDADRRVTVVAAATGALAAPGELDGVGPGGLDGAGSGGAPRPGEFFGPEAERTLAAAVAAQILAVPAGRPAELRPDLVLTEPVFDLMTGADAVTFSGGVAEYIFDRDRTDHGDLGRAIAAEIRAAIARGALAAPVLDTGQGIRATVVGASQFSVQVTGNTVAVSGAALPLRNLPVVHPRIDLAGDIAPEAVAAAIARAARARDLSGGDPFAIALRWSGPPSYPRLRALAEGIAEGLRGGRFAGAAGEPPPAVILLDRDLAASLGALLVEEMALPGPLVCLDNLEFAPLDYVDIGPRIWPAGVFPVVIKSLLFDAAGRTAPGDPPRQAASNGAWTEGGHQHE
ncbi:ethanolamine ammonia-lyase reactivating factor EutA [Rugosimonospora acidiphila]|uniref:Ethanolamine ammonia-lyase reactivating factor EutA n=1 Tax=Rugosimonospora acidiphila TaxID=556531 RepID=A0ABP9SRL1_9ACTN